MLVTSIQIASQQGESKVDRLQKAEQYLSQLYESGQRPAQILFPELWATGFFAFDSYKTQAEPERGDIFDLMCFWAKKFGCYIHTGSFVEKDQGRYYNTSLLLSPAGCIVGKYRKLHLFSFCSDEGKILTPGTQITVVQTDYGKVGLSTCYDLRFPELFRAMVNLGAEYYLVSSAWPLSRINHWKIFNQARAIENQCFVISCNGTGTLDGNQLGGHSMIVDPWGAVLDICGEQESIMQQEINPNVLADNRNNFPALKDKHLI